MSQTIKINTGAKKYSFKDEHNRTLGTIYFNPLDTGLATDLYNFTQELETICEPLGKIQESDSAEETFKRIQVATTQVKEKMNVVFKNDVSSTLFNTTDPFAILDTEKNTIFIEIVLIQLIKIIEEAMAKSGTANSKTNKYTKGYEK